MAEVNRDAFSRVGRLAILAEHRDSPDEWSLSDLTISDCRFVKNASIKVWCLHSGAIRTNNPVSETHLDIVDDWKPWYYDPNELFVRSLSRCQTSLCRVILGINFLRLWRDAAINRDASGRMTDVSETKSQIECTRIFGYGCGISEHDPVVDPVLRSVSDSGVSLAGVNSDPGTLRLFKLLLGSVGLSNDLAQSEDIDKENAPHPDTFNCGFVFSPPAFALTIFGIVVFLPCWVKLRSPCNIDPDWLNRVRVIGASLGLLMYVCGLYVFIERGLEII